MPLFPFFLLAVLLFYFLVLTLASLFIFDLRLSLSGLCYDSCKRNSAWIKYIRHISRQSVLKAPADCQFDPGSLYKNMDAMSGHRRNHHLPTPWSLQPWPRLASRFLQFWPMAMIMFVRRSIAFPVLSWIYNSRGFLFRQWTRRLLLKISWP